MVIKKTFAIIFISLFLNDCSIADEYSDIQEFAVDQGENLTIPCSDESSSDFVDAKSVMWLQNGRGHRHNVDTYGNLSLIDLIREDSGIYSCINNSNGDVKRRVKVEVRTTPPALVNVTVHPSTVLASLYWKVSDNGGYEITHFTAQYRRKYDENGIADTWHYLIPEHISPNTQMIDVYQLHPNTTYSFRIWANNQLGKGEVTKLEATTRHDMEEVELARHLLGGAENFDTRVWVAAVAVVMGTLLMLAVGTCYLLYKECHIPSIPHDEQEVIELVPNIILNPGFYEGEAHTEHIEPDENSNDQTTTRINNNTIVQPIRV